MIRRRALFIRSYFVVGLILLLAGSAQADRAWMEIVDGPLALPNCPGRSETELNCALTECIGYGEGEVWADEVQLRFCLPLPEQGGPWLVEYVAFFLSADGPRAVRVRAPGDGCSAGEPGAVLSQDEGFTVQPASDTWPPSGWSIVELAQDLPLPGYLLRAGDDPFCIGVELQAGDAIGLANAGALEGVGWGHFAGAWEDDTSGWNLTPAIRIGLADLGLTPAAPSTWGRIKHLFR